MKIFATIFIIGSILSTLMAAGLEGTAKNIINGTGNFGNVQISTDFKGMVSQLFTEIRKGIHTSEKTSSYKVQSSKVVDATNKTSAHKVQHTKEVHGKHKKSSSDPVDRSTNKFLQSLFV
ncbi:uncharacterized protein LOC119604175 [Lucilia sericata]|uniref:uncharacterized protein LOC119604175 n=1 Tax=Lucilia sericata TaxID=13632 RepID=UPI0018A864FB|nr:uncharacterized protein LOC119604175 [Lucilia sericata]